MKIYTLDDTVIDKIIDDYIDYVTNSFSIRRQTSKWQIASIGSNNIIPEERALKYNSSIQTSMIYGDNNLPVKVYCLPKSQRLKIRPHFISLIHQLYLRYISNEIGEIVLNSEISQKIYRNYNYMLDAIMFQPFFFHDRESIGEFARDVYYINSPEKFKYVECKNRIVIDDLNKLSIEFSKLHKKEIDKAKSITSSKFIDCYNKSLKTYRLDDINGAQEFIKSNNTLSDHSKLYYSNIINKISNNRIKEIDRADDNGRIYHIVTQTPKLLRTYTNIKYTIDAKNSHPLLFNFFILEYYFNKDNINIYNKNYKNNYKSLYLIISKFIKNNIYNKDNNHYFRKDLCNHLNNNGIQNNCIAIVKTIPQDVWGYMISTSQGKLWDEINESYPDFTRDEIKVEMFSSLFYSYAKNIKKNKIYAKAFQRKCPTVTKIIRSYKRTFHDQCQKNDLINLKDGWKKDKVQLAHKLMQIESYIFTEILTKLYKKESFRGVAIHDAIAVFNNSISPEEVEIIMQKVYFEVGLCPTFTIERADFNCETIYKKVATEVNGTISNFV